MKQFQEKKQIKSRFYSRLTVAGLVILVLLLANGVWNIYSREKQSSEMRAQAEAKLNDLQSQKDNLGGEIDKLSDQAGVEEEIRTKFNVVKPGENVVVIVNADASTTATSTPGFWSSLWRKVW